MSQIEKCRRVVVAMSGGVDSSVAAALLVEQGYEVIGVMLNLWREPGEPERRLLAAADQARDVAHTLGIPFHLLDCTAPFKASVVDAFIAEYGRGRTPNPCLMCNHTIKFGWLLEAARSLGADFLATGHYACVVEREGQYHLLRGLDRAKDQSYVLHMLGQAQLRRVLFPLGQQIKRQVRQIAADRGLQVAHQEESQEICFVSGPDRDGYRRFLQTYAPYSIRPGPILDTAGRELGQHSGLPFYTIGQRRGLGLAWPEPLYVLDIDVEHNALIVGPAAQLGHSTLRAQAVNYVAGHPPGAPLSVTVKIRYKAEDAPATLYPQPDDHALVQLTAPLRDITPGQGVVFYQGEEVIGGGIIAAGKSGTGF